MNERLHESKRGDSSCGEAVRNLWSIL
jgi:hypothetical protein